MKGWLRRSTSNPSGSSGTNRSSPSRWKRSINASAHLWPSKADPTTWQEAFQSHWLQAYSIIQQCNSGTVNGEQVCTIFNHLDQMFLLLLTESNSQEERVIGPILDYFFTEDILSQVFQWILTTPHSVQSTCQLNMLKLYEGLVTQSYQCLLVHKPILYPLLKILDHCSKSPKSSSSTEEVEKHFVLLLNQICTKIVDDSTLLEFFFNKSSAEEGPRFLVFTLMIPYLYVELDVGQLARDAMLLILAVSRKVESVGHFIAEHSNFCPVLATGLSGLFSQLPRRLTSAICASDDWHRITMADVEAIPAMHSFYSSLVFCNAVVQVGHSFVLEQLLDYMYHGFLVSVVGPALYESGLEESVSVTAYLDLCFRTVTEPALMKIFIRFILSEQYEGKKVLETLVDRINNNSRLCLISLALFSTLLELNCEDLLLELLLKLVKNYSMYSLFSIAKLSRYLIPSTHIMVSQTQNLKGSDYYGKTAEKFLSLIPRCCKNSSGFEKNNISTGTRQKRSACSVQSSQQQHQLLNGTSENRDVTTSSHDIETSPPYLEYLLEAREKVQGVYKACSSWSLPYDGENPDPEIFREIGSMISSTATSPISSPPISERSATSSSAFKRQGSLRRSRPNSYFTRRHTSNLLLTETSPNKMTTTDLAVLGPEEFEEVGDPFDLSSPSDSGPPSTFSTPRFEKSGVSMPTDYFKLAFDDDSVPCQTSDSQGEELDTVVVTRGGKRSVSTSFILRGWTEVQDLNTFVEVLNRVRTSKKWLITHWRKI